MRVHLLAMLLQHMSDGSEEEGSEEEEGEDNSGVAATSSARVMVYTCTGMG